MLVCEWHLSNTLIDGLQTIPRDSNDSCMVAVLEGHRKEIYEKSFNEHQHVADDLTFKPGMLKVSNLVLFVVNSGEHKTDSYLHCDPAGLLGFTHFYQANCGCTVLPILHHLFNSFTQVAGKVF